MTVVFKDKELALKQGYSKAFYHVIVHYSSGDATEGLVIIDDNLRLVDRSKSDFDIVDAASDLVQNDALNCNRTLFINNSLQTILNLKTSWQSILSDDIWTRSKLSQFFKRYNYELPEEYIQKVLNEDYKFNLIEGYLMSVNIYIERKFLGGHYYEGFEFFIDKEFEELINSGAVIKQDSNTKFEQLELADYKAKLLYFIGDYLYDEIAFEAKSETLVVQLFQLVDSIFMEPIEAVYKYETFYDNRFIVKYKGKFYTLNKYWYG